MTEENPSWLSFEDRDARLVEREEALDEREKRLAEKEQLACTIQHELDEQRALLGARAIILDNWTQTLRDMEKTLNEMRRRMRDDDA